MTSSSKPKISIVGAGIGGLTLAAALQRFGFAVEIFEQTQAFSRVGAGIQLTPNAVKSLRGLGLEGRLREVGYEAEYRSSREWNTGREILRIPMGRHVEEKYGAPHLLMHRGDLHQILFEAVGPSCIRYGHKLDGIEIQKDGVQLHFTNGVSEKTQYVVAADGVHSVVRDQLFEQGMPRYTHHIAYRTVFPSDMLKYPLRDPKSKWRGPDRQISIYYVSGGREVYFTTRVPDPREVPESWGMEGDMNELRAAFAEFHPEVRDMLEACPRVQKWAIFDRDPIPQWHRGPVVLLGDAAHPMTPAMAQGAASAMEDAVMLARLLGEIEVPDVEEAFARYEACRYDRASAIQVESSRDQWNWTTAGSALPDGVDINYVYSYDAWADDRVAA